MRRRVRAAVLVVGSLPLSAAAQQADTVVTLPPVTVSVARGDDPVTRLPLAVTVLRPEDLDIPDPGVSLAAVLAAVPGATSQNRHSLARDESLAIRGFGARAAFGIRGVRIILDGIPQTLPDGQAQLTNVDVRRIRRVEVVRGATSVLYGNAAGGVVSLSTDRQSVGRPEPDARTLFGTHDLLLLDAGLTLPAGPGRVSLDASRQSSAGHREQSAFEILRAGARGVWPAGTDTRLTATARIARMPEARDPGALTGDELAADPAQANPRHVTVDAGKEVTQGQAGLSLEHRFAAGGRVEASVFGLGRELEQRLPFATIEIWRQVAGARASASVPLARSAWEPVAVVGVDGQWLRDNRLNRRPADRQVTRDQRETVREAGPFVQLRARPVPRVTLLTGARYDWITFGVTDRFRSDGDDSGGRTMSAVSGMGGAALEVAPRLAVYANVGTSFETPTTTELGNQPDGSGGFNQTLEPQRAVQVEVGTRGSAGPLAFGVSLYRAAVRDALIPFEIPTDPGRRYFRNAGRARHRGVEVDAGIALAPGVNAQLVYTLSDHEFVDFAVGNARYDGNRIPGVPVHLARAALGARRGIARVGVEVRAASDVPVDDANSANADGWWVADVRVAADLRMGAWRFTPSGGVENLFDRTYVPAVAVNGAGGRYYEPAPRRSVYVSVEVRAGE